MILNDYFPLIITFVITLIGSYITIKINITELKKDISYFKSKIDSSDSFIKITENQSKIDMKEVKQDLKLIFKSINDMQVNFARMEARNEGKDDVINELKNAVTTILKDKK
jgi:hypothetical protein